MFKPGQSGNPEGRKRTDLIAQAIRIALKEPHNNSGKRKLRVMAEKLVEEAIEGNVHAIKEIADRVDGRPIQQQIISGDPDAPLRTISTEAPKSEDWIATYGIAANQD